MKIPTIYQRRLIWLNVPSTILITLLQRVPVLRVAVMADEMVIASPFGALLRSAFVGAATFGTVHTLVGATELAPSTPSPASASVGTPITIAFGVNGTVSGADTWTTGGSVPPGLAFSGQSSETLVLSGTPTTAGNYTVTIQAHDAAGGDSSTFNYSINVGGGVATSAPNITTQPSSQTVAPGGNVTFTAAANGTPAPTYQWRKDGVDLGGQTNASLTLNNVQAANAGTYTVVATNSAGSATSNGAVLTVSAVTAAPSITTQPSSQTVAPGGNVTFTAAASGAPAPTYQWRRNGVDVSGATNASLTLNDVQAANAGTYTVVATNSVGTATSNGAVLTVTAATVAPNITTQPDSQTVTPGGSVTFTVAASGNPTPTYQWRRDGVNIAGATSASLTLNNVQAANAGTYTVVATNSAGTATSSGAVLTVSAAMTAPTIATQPGNQSVVSGGNATLTVVANGNPTPTYQWYFGGAAISGATSASLTVSNVQRSDAGSYYVTATNSEGMVISATATLSVLPLVTVQSTQNQITSTGHNVAVSAPAGLSNLQWQVSSDGGSTWSALSNGGTYQGVNATTLLISGATAALNGNRYRYVDAGGADSTTMVTILSVADAFFPMPSGITLDSAGNLYVADNSTNTISKISSAGQVALLAGASGQTGTTDGSGTAARFNQPWGIAIAADGSLVVADSANGLIRRITAAGVVTTLAGSSANRGNADGTGSAATFSTPAGIVLDASGNAFVADSMNHTIRQITPAGVVTTLAGSAGLSGSADGTGAAASFNFPTGMAIDGAGNLYVSDATNNTIRKIASGGVVTTLAGLAGVSGTSDGTGTDALFNNPTGLAADSAGNLYVTDTGNSVIRKIAPDGTVTTLAGLAGIAGLQDGSGMGAWFNQPKNIAVDAAGNVYVSDTGNAVLRKVTSSGAVNTMALSAAPTSGGGGGSPGGGSSGGSGAAGSGPRQGGGGSPSSWFLASLGLLTIVRWVLRYHAKTDSKIIK